MTQKIEHCMNMPARATVIIPTYNDRENLVQWLAASMYNCFDVIAFDNGSTESIKPLVDRFGYQYLRINGPGGLARERNWGAQQTESEFIIFIEADVCVHPDTIADNVELCQGPGPRRCHRYI